MLLTEKLNEIKIYIEREEAKLLSLIDQVRQAEKQIEISNKVLSDLNKTIGLRPQGSYILKIKKLEESKKELLAALSKNDKPAPAEMKDYRQKITELEIFLTRLKEEYAQKLSYREGIDKQIEADKGQLNEIQTAKIQLSEKMIGELNSWTELIKKTHQENETFLKELSNKDIKLKTKEKGLILLENNLILLENQWHKKINELRVSDEKLRKERLLLINKKNVVELKERELSQIIEEQKKTKLAGEKIKSSLAAKAEKLKENIAFYNRNNLMFAQKLESISKQEAWQTEFQKQLEKQKIKILDERSLLERAKNEIYSKLWQKRAET